MTVTGKHRSAQTRGTAAKPSSPRGMRRAGRELAVKVLFSLQDQTRDNLRLLLDGFWGNFRFAEDVLGEPLEEWEAPPPAEVRKFTEALVFGVCDNLGRIDGLISELSTNWSIERMARVDLAILRLATYELLFNNDVPASVVINEAIEIGKRFGTRETQAFVNGILDQLSRKVR